MRRSGKLRRPAAASGGSHAIEAFTNSSLAMATILFVIGFLGLLIWPRKYASAGGYGLFYSALTIALLVFEKEAAFHSWIFWLLLFFALGHSWHWLRDKLKKEKP